MNPTEIEFAVKALVAKPFDAATFPFELIRIYNAPKTTVSKLKSGQTNAAAKPADVLWKKRLFYRTANAGDDVAVIADSMLADPLVAKHTPRFILVANGVDVHVRDRTLDETCNTTYESLDQSSEFLLPLAGMERRAVIQENPADIKAAKRLAKLYDAILAANRSWSDGNHTHELNLFMTRVLFCFYAEDTGIFDTPQIFSSAVAQHTHEDGSDVAPFLDRLFRVMNLTSEERPVSLASIEKRFPYVNGSLFETALPIPAFNRVARRLFLECGELDWKTINPDIFGSMIQTIAEPGARSELGMHYTNVPNIMKVLEPLFLDSLNEEYKKSKDSHPKLTSLLRRLAGIRVFDPACGCGNFLIIAYRELRRIEMRVLFRLSEIGPDSPLLFSGISLQNFFGIDIVDFACETAKLSLWLVEYQMNSAFKELFGTTRPPLPLGKITTIHYGNAVRLDWQSVCMRDQARETYICGNPPYQGGKKQSANEKSDVADMFAGNSSFKNLDYVACWLLKAADYIADAGGTAAFVATNSICQGENVPILWPRIFARQLCIVFAYTSFHWKNNAAHNAGVTCIIVGIGRAQDSSERRLYSNDHVALVSNVSPYLTPTRSVVVEKALAPLNSMPEMVYGSKPLDWGHLTLVTPEKVEIETSFPASAILFRRYIGSDEFIDGTERWCLWIPDDLISLANSIEPIRRRLSACQLARESGGMSARSMALVPWRFMIVAHQDTEALLIPMVSSERRPYLQIGVMSSATIINSNAYAIYNPPLYVFSVLSSRMHAVWAAAIGGRMRNDPRYSHSFIYNTFPIPRLSEENKRVLADYAKGILKARGSHPGKSIAWMYNPETMPDDVRAAHQSSDTYLDEHVYGRRFPEDDQRLENLFSMYERMIANSQQNTSLF